MIPENPYFIRFGRLVHAIRGVHYADGVGMSRCNVAFATTADAYMAAGAQALGVYDGGPTTCLRCIWNS